MHKNAMRRRRKAVGKRLRDCLFIVAARREVSPKATGRGMSHDLVSGESVAETGEGVLFLSSTTEKDTKKNALEGLR